MLLGSWANVFFAPQSFANHFLRLIGSSVIALLIATLVSFYTFGKARGFDRDEILKFTTECLAPIAGIVLIVGAGAGFGRILLDGGVSKAIIDVATKANLSPLLLGWRLEGLGHGHVEILFDQPETGVVDMREDQRTGAGGEHHQFWRRHSVALGDHRGEHAASRRHRDRRRSGADPDQGGDKWTACETIISVVALLLTLGLAAVIA